MRADGERKPDEDEDERGERKREALVPLHFEGRPAERLVGEDLDLLLDLRERQVLLRFLEARGALERRVDRQTHVVDAEQRVPVAAGGGRATVRLVAGRLRRRGQRVRLARQRRRRQHVGLVHRAVDQAQRDASIHLVGQEPTLPRGDDPREARISLVGDEQTAQRHPRRADLFRIDDDVAEVGVEDALLQPARRARLQDLEELGLKLAVRRRADDDRERAGHHGDGDRRGEDRTEETERPHAGGLEGDDLEIPRESTATSSAIGSGRARNEGIMKTRSCITRWSGTPLVMTRSVRL